MIHVTPTVVHQDPLLTTKLYIPRTRPGQRLVVRPRLLDQLNESLDCTLTFISAPAGFGKTTLLSSWIQQLQSDPPLKGITQKIAWLSLDESDNHPAHFLSYAIAALQTIHPDLGQPTFDLFTRYYPDIPSDEELLKSLINEIATIPDEFVLIFDDYHLINTQRTHDALTFLLDYQPPQMHLIIASRSDPPLPLARLRARGQLVELRATDLRFTPDEVATFLNQTMGLDLSATNIAALEARTEGWIAGLQLAALSMQDQQDVAGFIANFTGSHRYIFDYLAEEVLQRQPEPVQHFLLNTSILNHLTGPLCDALMLTSQETAPKSILTPASQELLEYLEQTNLFIMPLDDQRRWYRYHRLFADFLQNHLQRQIGLSGIVALHRQAADWYEQHGLEAEAVSHAFAVADVERAARLIEQQGGTLLSRTELSTLLNWVEALPQEMMREQPRLSLFQLWALVFTGQLDEVEVRLREVEQGGGHPTLSEEDSQSTPLPRAIPGEVTAIRATVAYLKRDLPQAIDLYREAFDKLPADNLFLRGAVVICLATAYSLAGDLNGAKWAYNEGCVISEANNDLYTIVIANLNLAYLYAEQAQLHQAADRYRYVLQLAKEPPDLTETTATSLKLTGRAHVELGEIFYQWNELEKANTHFVAGLQWGEQYNDTLTLLNGYLGFARLKWAEDDTAEALAYLEKAAMLVETENMTSWLVQLAAQQVFIQIKQGELEAAAYWVHKSQSSLAENQSDDLAGYPQTLAPVVQLAQARTDKILPGHVLANLKRFHKKVQEQQPGTKVW
ncbi:MAG: helix-turn-helix transcriptional regulator, partial [Chloroflexota bacterium]